MIFHNKMSTFKHTAIKANNNSNKKTSNLTAKKKNFSKYNQYKTNKNSTTLKI